MLPGGASPLEIMTKLFSVIAASIVAVSTFAVSAFAEPYTEPVAIFVGPTDAEIEFAQKNYDDERYSSWLDHGGSNSYSVKKAIKQLGIPTVSSGKLEFEFSVNGVIHPYSLKNREYQWSVIMFNGVDPPREFFSPFDPDMPSYFGQGADQ